MYIVDKLKSLDSNTLSKILLSFQTLELPHLIHYKKYYDGEQDILWKSATDVGKPCNRVVVNYCKNITDTYQGYLTGVPITYTNDKFNEVIDVLNYNDVTAEDNEFLRNALIYGIAYEINYIDAEGKQRFKTLDPRECIPVYDNTLDNELLYVIRFWREDIVNDNGNNEQRYYVEVYGDKEIVTYKSWPGFASFEEISRVPHYYNMCPVTVFDLNTDNRSIFGQIISMQDAYNNLISSEVDDFEAFCDAYLVLKGVTAEEDDLVSMKKNRVLMIDADADANYLTKSVSDTQIQNMLQNLNDQIHKISASPDFNDEKLLAQSGIAMRYKLVGFETNASNIETNMRQALQRRIELINAILNLTDEAAWRDVQIKFTRNLPVDMTETITLVQGLQGIVSNYTLLQQIPFVHNVEEELERVKEQKAENMSLYNFGDMLNEQSDNESAVLDGEN